MIRVGIIGAAGYTGGELIRLLLNHKQAKLIFAHSESCAGKSITEVHDGLEGETNMSFTRDLPLDEVDVVFLCLGHGRSKALLEQVKLPDRLHVIDLSQDFRLRGDHPFVYGLPELNRAYTSHTGQNGPMGVRLANPGCFATAIQLALLPALKSRIITGDIHASGITGSTGAGVKPSESTHYSWRNDNISIYKAFTHQHLGEVNQTLRDVYPDYQGRLFFLPHRGCFSRGIFVSAYATCSVPLEEARQIYDTYYQNQPLTHHVRRMPAMKEVVNTAKALVYVDQYDDQLLMIACIDNLLKGAVGQAVQNMNILFGLDELEGLRLKASAY